LTASLASVKITACWRDEREDGPEHTLVRPAVPSIRFFFFASWPLSLPSLTNAHTSNRRCMQVCLKRHRRPSPLCASPVYAIRTQSRGPVMGRWTAAHPLRRHSPFLNEYAGASSDSAAVPSSLHLKLFSFCCWSFVHTISLFITAFTAPPLSFSCVFLFALLFFVSCDFFLWCSPLTRLLACATTAIPLLSFSRPYCLNNKKAEVRERVEIHRKRERKHTSTAFCSGSSFIEEWLPASWLFLLSPFHSHEKHLSRSAACIERGSGRE
jgi:hypothetical protein